MRRSSIVAPLLLIGIGGLFLARNLYPDLPLMDYLAKYWPFLLIVWGGLRLAEVLFWASTDRSVPARGVSAGEWVLVVFLCMFGASVHAVRGFNTWWPRNVTIGGLDMFGESYEYPVSGEKATTKTPHVVIESFRGNARITGGDVDAVKVTGNRSIRSLDQNGADNANRSAPFEVTGDSNQVNIRSNYERLNGGNVRITANLEITVPRGSTIEAHGRYGDFDITDVNGNVEILSDNAGVRLQNLGGDARIDLRRSDVIRASNIKGTLDVKGNGTDIDLSGIQGPVTINGTYSGVIQFRNLDKPLRYKGPQTELSFEKLPGSVRFALGDFTGSGIVGPTILTSRNKDIQIGDFTNSLELSIQRGDIELRPGRVPLSRIDATTRSGDIELAIPQNAKFDLNASTSRGDVTNDFGAPLRTDSESRGSSIRGAVPGGPSITLHTERGQVSVRKASADDKPMTPKTDGSTSLPVPATPLKKIEQ
jgi:DUF4097 and DUF4098 domain-containing protein YvlB